MTHTEFSLAYFHCIELLKKLKIDRFFICVLVCHLLYPMILAEDRSHDLPELQRTNNWWFFYYYKYHKFLSVYVKQVRPRHCNHSCKTLCINTSQLSNRILSIILAVCEPFRFNICMHPFEWAGQKQCSCTLFLFHYSHPFFAEENKELKMWIRKCDAELDCKCFDKTCSL